MQIKRFLVMSASICGLINTTASGTSFTAGVRLAATIQKQKAEIKVSRYGINDARAKLVLINDTNANANKEPDATWIGKLASDANSPYQARIIARDYNFKPSSYFDALMNGNWLSDAKMVFGGQAVVFFGVKFGKTTVSLGILGELPFANKKIATSFSRGGNGSTSSNNKNDDKSSSSNSNSLCDVTETKKMNYGFLMMTEFAINDSFSAGIEVGIKFLRSEFDFSKAYQNLLGFGSVPEVSTAGTSKEALSDGSTALKRLDGLETVQKVKGKAIVPFGGILFKFKLNSHFAFGLSAGVQGGQSYKLYNESSKIEKPDFTAKCNTGVYGTLGMALSI